MVAANYEFVIETVHGCRQRVTSDYFQAAAARDGLPKERVSRGGVSRTENGTRGTAASSEE